MKKGINAWCFPESYRLQDMTALMERLSFTGLELNLSEDKEDILHLETSEAEMQDILHHVREAGLTIPSISTALLWEYPLTGSEEESAKGIAVVEKMIEAADVLGASAVLVVPGLVTPEVSYEEAYDRGVQALKKLAKTAERHNVRIGIENVWNKFLLSPLEMKAFIDDIDSPFVGAYLDLGNIIQFGYPEQWIRILKDKTVAVHVKGFNEAVGNITGFGPLLTGDVNWAEISRTLAETGYDGYITPEVLPHKYHPEFLLKLTSQTLDEFF